MNDVVVHCLVTILLIVTTWHLVCGHYLHFLDLVSILASQQAGGTHPFPALSLRMEDGISLWVAIMLVQNESFVVCLVSTLSSSGV